MKKILSLSLITTVIAACGNANNAKAKSSGFKSEGLTRFNVTEDLVKHELVVNGDNTFKRKIARINKFIDDQLKAVDNKKEDVKFATDNPYIANLLDSLDIPLVAMTDYSEFLQNEEIKFKLQNFNAADYDCGPFSRAIYKAKENACYVDGEKSETIKPQKLEKYGRSDIRPILNLGLPRQIDQHQLKNSGATGFLTALDVIENKIKIPEMELSFNFLDDYYIFLETFGLRLSPNESLVLKKMIEIKKTQAEIQRILSISKEKGIKAPTIQFVYIDSNGKMYKPTRHSTYNKLAEWIGAKAVGFGKNKRTKDINEERLFKNGLEEIKSLKDIQAKTVIFVTSDKWARYVSYNKMMKMNEKDAHVVRDGKIIKKSLVISDISQIQDETPRTLAEITSFLFDE